MGIVCQAHPFKQVGGVVFFLLKTAFDLKRKKGFRKLNQIFHYRESWCIAMRFDGALQR
jgi:hypothetical protein